MSGTKHHASSITTVSAEQSAPKIMSLEKVKLVETDIESCMGNGMIIHGARIAQDLICDLDASARALKDSGDTIQAREQAIKVVELIHNNQRYSINEATEGLINTYYNYPSTMDEDDVNDIFDLAKSMADATEDPVHAPSMILLTEFLEKLKMNSKKASNEQEHVYSAEQAELAAIVAGKIAEMFPEVAISNGKKHYSFPTERSVQGTFAAEQYALAIDQEHMQASPDYEKISGYVGRVRKLHESIRNTLLRRIDEGLEPLEPLAQLEQPRRESS